MKKNIWIIILVGIICLGVGFGCSYKFLKETNKCEDKKIETKCDVPFEEEEIKKEQHTGDYEQLLNKINDMRYLEYMSKSFKVEELTNLEILRFTLNFIDDKYDEDFSLDRVNEIATKYFGREIEGEDVPCTEDKDVMLFIYDKDKKEFKNNPEHGGHGGLGIYSPTVLNRIIDINAENNLYTISVKKAFAVSLADTGFITAYYRTYNDAYNEKNKLFDINASDEDYIDAIDYYYPEVEFNKIENDKLNTYTYVFEKSKDNIFTLKSYSFK